MSHWSIGQVPDENGVIADNSWCLVDDDGNVAGEGGVIWSWATPYEAQEVADLWNGIGRDAMEAPR